MLSKITQLFNEVVRRRKVALSTDDAELDWLFPPPNPLDVAGWDKYWTDQVSHGFGPALFDMFCDDRELVRVMNEEGMKRILCAGNGISQEPRALAEAGFEVVALDLSPKAIDIAQAFEFSSQSFGEFCPAEARRPGGSVNFIVGDVLNPAVCPGPFDVIIERRTAQLYPNDDAGTFLNALAQRASSDSIFLSHCHDAAWKPPAEPRHFTRQWFQENRWTIWSAPHGQKPQGRVAWLFMSTG
jgi:hypothetical protein